MGEEGREGGYEEKRGGMKGQEDKEEEGRWYGGGNRKRGGDGKEKGIWEEKE